MKDNILKCNSQCPRLIICISNIDKTIEAYAVIDNNFEISLQHFIQSQSRSITAFCN